MLTYQQYQDRQRKIYADWNKQYADRIPTAYPAGSNPHHGDVTDYAEHHAIMSASDTHIEILHERLAELDREWLDPSNAANRQKGA